MDDYSAHQYCLVYEKKIVSFLKIYQSMMFRNPLSSTHFSNAKPEYAYNHHFVLACYVIVQFLQFY